MNIQLKNPYISPVSSPSPTRVVPLELPQEEQVVPQVLFLQETFLPSYSISSPGVSFLTPTTDKISKENCKKIDLPDLVSMTDIFEKRADVLFDGIKQLFDCKTPSIDEEKSNYDVDVTRSPTPLSTLQLCFELLQAD